MPTTKCFVPILSVTEWTEPSFMFGYDQAADVPYILSTSLEEYNLQTRGWFGFVEGMVYHGNILVPPLALFPNEVAARLALDDIIMLREQQ